MIYIGTYTINYVYTRNVHKYVIIYVRQIQLINDFDRLAYYIIIIYGWYSIQVRPQ